MSKYAIVGFGCAGYHAAKEIRSRDPEGVIDVYSDTDMGPYNPMLTTYYVKGSIPYESMFPFGSLKECAKDLNLTVHTRNPVTALEAESRTIVCADGTKESYDRILISSGASAVMPPIPGLTLPGVFKMRTAQDAVQLKNKIESGKIRSALVIGASWVGIKVVEDFVEANIPTTLVDGAPWMFYVAAFEETSRRAQKDLEEKGVRVSCCQMLDHIEKNADGTLTAFMKSGDTFTADTIAVCIGVRTNTGFLKDSGIEENRGILVDQRMQTNVSGIYAAGDCAAARDIQSGLKRNIGIWYNAGVQGTVAGANMAGAFMEFDANILVNLAHYLDYDFICMGDVSSCTPEDEYYEYESDRLYIKACRESRNAQSASSLPGTDSDTAQARRKIKCMNMIGSADTNGVVKNIFIKSIETPEAGIDMRSICTLLTNGFPMAFIHFLSGK